METTSTRGGRREGAGRKRASHNQQDPQHTKRPPLDYRHPVHVMLRTRKDVPRLRQRRVYDAIRRVLFRFLSHVDLRIIHISIQRNHLHLIVEARDEAALSRGMQGFAGSAARAVNKALGRSGKVFQFRYKAKQIKTREYARNVIAYVLNNWRKHKESWNSPNTAFDDYSSAQSFTGWWRKRGDAFGDFPPLPVSQPRTSLLRIDWQWYGLIDPWEVPGHAE